jgi:hypothetical protein
MRDEKVQPEPARQATHKNRYLRPLMRSATALLNTATPLPLNCKRLICSEMA